jgi:hypothetical protein
MPFECSARRAARPAQRAARLCTWKEKMEDAQLLGDYRPACTIWKRSEGDLDVFVLQGEGGALEERDLAEAAERMLVEMPRSARFATLYDLTEGIKNLMSCAPALLAFGAEQRRRCGERQACAIVVCPNRQARDWVRWIVSILPGSVPLHIVKDADAAWGLLAAAASGDGLSTDVYGETYDVPLSVDVLKMAS